MVKRRMKCFCPQFNRRRVDLLWWGVTGTAPAYYFVPGTTTGAAKWYIHHQVGTHVKCPLQNGWGCMKDGFPREVVGVKASKIATVAA
jgi:hypothetical protein